MFRRFFRRSNSSSNTMLRNQDSSNLYYHPSNKLLQPLLLSRLHRERIRTHEHRTETVASRRSVTRIDPEPTERGRSPLAVAHSELDSSRYASPVCVSVYTPGAVCWIYPLRCSPVQHRSITAGCASTSFARSAVAVARRPRRVWSMASFVSCWRLIGSSVCSLRRLYLAVLYLLLVACTLRGERRRSLVNQREPWRVGTI